MTYSVLFVCTGNICRSPTAEGILRRDLAAAGWQQHILVDSAGTHAYHVGEPPDVRSIAAAKNRGADITHLRARKVSRDDFRAFDLILACDTGHLHHLQRMRPANATAEVALFLEHANIPRAREVPDPYYGTHADFEYVLDLSEQASSALIEHFRKRIPPLK